MLDEYFDSFSVITRYSLIFSGAGTFNSLSDESQKLYIRLYTRKGYFGTLVIF